MGLNGMGTLSGEATLMKLYLFPFQKGSILKGKNLLHLGANSLFTLGTFSEETVQESNHSHKICLPSTTRRKSTMCIESS